MNETPELTIAVSGAAGRMGRAVVRHAASYGLRVCGALGSGDEATLDKDVGLLAGLSPLGVFVSADPGAALLGVDCVVDFSSAAGLARVAHACASARVPLISGTTGLDEAAQRAVAKAASQVPVLISPNMSVGVYVLARLVEQAVRALGAGFDCEIVEVHHNKKADAPSGTAKRLQAAIGAGRGDLREVHGRNGLVGARAAAELGVHAVRGGDVVGDHTVHLLGLGERLELTHRATNREVFACGALRAVRPLIALKPGQYSMADVIEVPA